MRIEQAGPDDVRALAGLLWRHASPQERAAQEVEAFAVDLGRWWREHGATHVAFVARSDDGDVVGAAWLALLARPPRPGASGRWSADVQSVFVEPGARGRGAGSALVTAACQHARDHGAARVTVSSSTRAVPLYTRLGFAPSDQLLETTTTSRGERP
ncbi:hypothetical protein GCM10027446_09650 [Angustibacter peucedani]